MKLTDYYNILRHNVIRKKIFRNEAELAIYSGKEFALPDITQYDEISLEAFRTGYPLRFFSSVEELQKIRSEIERIEAREELFESAAKVMQNIIDLPGAGDTYLGEKIKWNYDYISGYEWGNEIVWKYDFYNFPKGVDITYPWELARMNQLLILGRAYLISGDKKYTEKILSILDDFIDNNPFCKGINWVSTTEISVRILNILYTLSFIIDSPSISAVRINRVLNFLLLSETYIENNIAYALRRDSDYFISNLALTASSLVFNASYFMQLFNAVFSDFEREIRLQIFNDGTSYEQSVPNHTITLEALYLAKLIYQKGGLKTSKEYDELLHKMFTAHAAYLRSDNSVPQIGETITGRMLKFNQSDLKNDYSSLIAAGAFIFKDGELKQIKPYGTPELLYLFGSEALDNYKKIRMADKKYISAEFPAGKHYIFRSEDLHLFVEAGEIGIHGNNTRGHSDIFSFELFYKNKNFIVDPGSLSAFADRDLNRELRSVKFHNTAYIDNQHLTPLNGSNKLRGDHTSPKIVEWLTNGKDEILTAEHYAYTRLQDPVICRRSFNFSRIKNTIRIKDEFLGGAEHTAGLNLFFHPDVAITEAAKNEFLCENDNVRIKVKLHTSSKLFRTAVQRTIYSPSFGIINPSGKLNIALEDKFPVSVLTEIELL